ncbi:MAG: 16S rRNA (cytosine(1402)-N(4))-methyltransferase RsmH [Chitinispirillaceae bacterium]|nr:16S rRNA (cytosine(1402)-N(4))-methyltransferase RsmH [Chitinispirillaceae bacterium]
MNGPHDYHTPVLLEEVLRFVPHTSRGVFLDGTLGGGGHFWAMAEQLDKAATLIGIDRDPDAVLWNRGRKMSCRPTVIIEQARFSQFDKVLERHGISSLDGMLLDIGVSSRQIDEPGRGFSYLRDGALDMRMDAGAGVCASEFIRASGEAELAAVLRDFGEVTGAGKIAAAIKEWSGAHPLRTTADLRECCARLFSHRLPIKLIARIFQALRIAVNDELGELRLFCAKVLDFLKPGGRLAVISYHSLEDRIVKQYIQEHERVCICPPELPRCVCSRAPLFKRLTKKAIQPSAQEIARNRRCRSARLRIVERTEAQP